MQNYCAVSPKILPPANLGSPFTCYPGDSFRRSHRSILAKVLPAEIFK
ncbi:hypothetical protein HMPREF1862_00160 [Varibaculum cambriense]|uniref:Uncharacterized protein n=1 Tax=Varibaculum cambriense TaxID=184870 RepID=A0AB34X1Q3_9ACTO|nr:hypothetical protein HMPREF1862_00160 [Varibaculum cambriense]